MGPIVTPYVRSLANHPLPQVVYAKCHIEWAKKNLEMWEEAKAEVEKIQAK